jgi:hypothetical protein
VIVIKQYRSQTRERGSVGRRNKGNERAAGSSARVLSSADDDKAAASDNESDRETHTQTHAHADMDSRAACFIARPTRNYH